MYSPLEREFMLLTISEKLLIHELSYYKHSLKILLAQHYEFNTTNLYT